MIKLLVTGILLLISLPALATLQAFVDRNPVAEGESLTLTLKSDESLNGDPDLSVLQQDFDVLGQSHGSSMQIINGSATRSVLWQITIIPKHNGQLVIPAIKAGGRATAPIVLGVIKADQARAAQQNGELFLEVGAEPHTVYVQQQIVFTVRLYSAANLDNQSSLSDPKFPGMDAVVERLGDDHSFQTTRNGQVYAVIERRYAVYPQKSGQFSSTPVQFDGEIIERNQGGGGFMFDPFNQRSRHKRVSSKTIPLTIKPAPAGVGGGQWLPTNKFELSEQWSENPPKFTANEPITRTVVISANGLTASQLPVLESQSIDGLKLYPDQPVLKDNKNDNGISGVRTQKIAILPARPGNFTLPEIEVKWWNVNTDKMEVARIPARNITVLPGNANPAGVNQAPALSAGISPLHMPEAADTAPGSPIVTNQPRGWWPWLSLFLGVGWLTTLILWWWRARNPSIKTESNDEESLRQLENKLKKSCLKNDAAQAKSELLAWAKVRWDKNPPASLTSMAALCPPALASALNELDRTLYGQNGGVWQGENLWQLFNQHKPVPVATQDGKRESLKPLYLASP
ncbi:MAG: BatD family protein [Gallionella sp.]|jgi:hypothetical protein